jgi:two-component system, chemotaxis family, chemotaxis protein CheY
MTLTLRFEMKVMLVDDSNSIVMMVTQMLHNAGFEVVRAKDGQNAIDLITSGEQVDFILLDWNMPNISGIDFLKINFEKHLVNCPIIMMTTENKPDKIREALKYGACEYIMKPFTEDILISKIQSVKRQVA